MKNTEFLVFIVLRALAVGYFTTIIEPLNLRFTPTCEFSIGYINRRLAGPPVLEIELFEITIGFFQIGHEIFSVPHYLLLYNISSVAAVRKH